jgi:hypothetical protein
MTIKLDRWIALVALSGLMAACYAGGEAPTAEEQVGEVSEALCEGYYPGADCWAQCGNAWYDVSYWTHVSYQQAQCESAAKSFCGSSYAGSCWGAPGL